MQSLATYFNSSAIQKLINMYGAMLGDMSKKDVVAIMSGLADWAYSSFLFSEPDPVDVVLGEWGHEFDDGEEVYEILELLVSELEDQVQILRLIQGLAYCASF